MIFVGEEFFERIRLVQRGVIDEIRQLEGR